jgi:hypothetical protein
LLDSVTERPCITVEKVDDSKLKIPQDLAENPGAVQNNKSAEVSHRVVYTSHKCRKNFDLKIYIFLSTTRENMIVRKGKMDIFASKNDLDKTSCSANINIL